MALGMEGGEWLMISDFLGTDGHGFYKKDTEGLRDGNGLFCIKLY